MKIEHTDQVAEFIKSWYPFIVTGIIATYHSAKKVIAKRKLDTAELYRRRDIAISQIPEISTTLTEMKDLLTHLSEQVECVSQELRAVWNLTDVPMWRSDPTGKCTFATVSLAELAGCEAGDLLNMGWLTRIHPEDRNDVREEYMNALNEKRPYNQLYRFTNSSGLVHVHSRAIPTFTSKGQVSSYIGKVTVLEKDQYDHLIRES